ncbi:PH domain-containing protein [Candidatus Woesearchaeota archaeon]|nr:PH domain-containing protein [Candidatus Woesearchaeota archaeon]
MADVRDLLQKNEKEPVLRTLRKTRKAFIVEYTCGFILLGLLGTLAVKGIALNHSLTYFVLGISLVSIGSAEFSRMIVRYKIAEDKLMIIYGLLKQSKKNVYFQALAFIPDLNIKQSRLQRLLNYGSVYLKSGGEHTFEIRDINNPQQVLDTIERLIEHNKSSGVRMV